MSPAPRIASVDPATGRVVAEFEPHDEEEVARRIGEAHDAFLAMRRTDVATRSAWMTRAAELVEADVDDLARTMTTEMGKPISQSRAEALKCARGMRFYADNAAAFLADSPLGDPGSVGASEALVRYEPLGVVLAVMPWNYPLWQVIRFAAPALMAGNSGLLKHASNVPQIALYLDALFERAGFPAGAFRALLIGSSSVEAVLRDARVRAVTLTGSEPAGRAVASIAGQEIKKAVLELGGSDPFIVMPSADIDRAVATAVTARVQNNGQSCIAAKRFLVHESVYARFAEGLTDAFSRLVVGDPAEEGTDVGPVATESGRDDLIELVEDARSKGATVLVGGEVVDGPGWFYPPTVVGGLTDEMRLVQEETFGPVASLYSVSDRDEALRIANQTSFGLSSSVWTEDAAEADFFSHGIEAGAVFVNGMSASHPQLPFGGIKNSGFGRELSSEGMREFLNVKSVWRASTD